MWWLYPGSVLLIVVGVLAWMAWHRRRAHASNDPLLILPKPVERFGKLPAADVEAMRARAEERRQAAAAKYRASVQNTFDRS
jgi:hypothetical protein